MANVKSLSPVGTDSNTLFFSIPSRTLSSYVAMARGILGGIALKAKDKRSVFLVDSYSRRGYDFIVKLLNVSLLWVVFKPAKLEWGLFCRKPSDICRQLRSSGDLLHKFKAPWILFDCWFSKLSVMTTRLFRHFW